MTFVNLLWLLVRPALLVPPLLPIPLGRHSPSQPLLPVTALTWVPWTDTLLTPWGPRISSTVAWDPRALHTGVGGTALIDKPLRCSSPLLARLDLCVIVQQIKSPWVGVEEVRGVQLWANFLQSSRGPGPGTGVGPSQASESRSAGLLSVCL